MSMRFQTETEYGVPATVAGARAWARICSAERRSIRTAGAYVAICRRLDPALARGGVAGVDGRLVAVGFRRVPPREWVLGDRRDGREPRRLSDFLAWWQATQPRPETVGSDYNADPAVAFRLWFAGPYVRRAAHSLGPHMARAVGRGGRLVRRVLRHADAIGRALRRSSLAHRLAPPVDSRVARRLGELCPELQRLVLEGAEERAVARNGWRPVVRLQDLDWEAVARWAPVLARDTTGRVRAALAWRDTGRNRRFLSLLPPSGDAAPWLCPYPGVPTATAVRLCLGEPPVEISGGHLTRREAHEWLTQGSCGYSGLPTPAEWLVRDLDLGGRVVRSPVVARWLLDVHRRGGWGGLTRERTVHGPVGATAVVRYLDRIDEIMDEDIVRPTASVDEVFRHAAQRAGEAWAAKHREDFRVLASAPRWSLYPCMRALVTPAQLVAEGREMGHCVGTYVPAVERGESHIIALSVRGHRSTVELAPDGRVRQHKGPGDGQPHVLCQRALALWCRRRGGNAEPDYQGGYR